MRPNSPGSVPRSSDVLTGLRLGLGTFTVIPAGPLPDIRTGHARIALLTAPLTSLPVAAVVAAVAFIGHHLHWPNLVSGALAVGAGAWATRGMHIDGLADTVDGLGAGWDRDRALHVMKSGDVGPMGVVSLIVVMLTQAAAVGALASHPLVVTSMWAAGRIGCAWVGATLNAARTSGLGTVMARSCGVAGCVIASMVTAAFSLLLIGFSGLPPERLFAAAAAAVAVLIWLCWRARRCFGGSTGDVFGASVELTTTALLVGMVSGGLS